MNRFGCRARLIVFLAVAVVAMPASGRAGDVSESRRPEPIVFDLMRRIQVSPLGPLRDRLRKQLGQWRARAHDRAVKIGPKWITAVELERHRELYIAALAEVEAEIKKLPRKEPATAAERKTLDRMYTRIGEKVSLAARQWADPLIRNFLTAQANLQTGQARQAERLFDQCVREQPLVAGFYQGRAMALAGVGRHLDAAADWVTLSYLRPGESLVVEGLRKALDDTPGTKISTHAFKEARLRLEEIDDPELRPRRISSRQGEAWLMPGGEWQGLKYSLPIPTCNTIFTRKAVAVPVNKAGVLLVDADALDDALELLLEIEPGRYLPAQTVRMRTSKIRDLKLPLAAVAVSGAAFTPVVSLGEQRIKPGERLTLVLHSAPGEMDGPKPREVVTRVKGIGPDGAPTLTDYGRPGEGAGPAFDTEGRLATFVAGRTDVFEDNGGPALAFSSADVAKYVEAAGKVRRRSRSRSRRSAEPPAKTVEGRTFTLHVLVAHGKAVVKK